MTPSQSLPDPASLAAALRREGVRDVRDDGTTRAAYTSDASLYRSSPVAVAFPREASEVEAALEVCRSRQVPLTCRGAGTSVAGNAVGEGLVLDFSRHMNRVLDVDPERRTAVVEPGTVHATLQRAVRAEGLRFGPDPSTHTRCTIGGMIGNNACGARTLAYGRTVDNLVGVDVLWGTGERTRLDDAGAPATPSADRLRGLVGGNLATIRTQLGRFGRQVSGYSLEHLLPERGFDLRRALAGSEGTLGIVLEASLRLVVDEPHRCVVVLGFPDIGAAGDAAVEVARFRPTACEGLDSRIVDVVRERKAGARIPELPRGAAWLFVEVSGPDALDVAHRAARIRDSGIAGAARVVTDPDEATALWRIREDGAGLAGRAPSGLPAHSGWEDAAVPPEHLGGYLRGFDALMERHGITGMPYGHFAEGCVHVRLDFPFGEGRGSGVFRDFMEEAADLVASFGGSLSGEHGDGRARSGLLGSMYPPEVLELFAEAKRILDPDQLLNPGIIVAPGDIASGIRTDEAVPVRAGLAFRYGADDGDLGQAVHRCTGVGRCRVVDTGPQKVMCPSYQATREEKDSTRGRARVLQEMIARPAELQWRAPEVHEALDLCLSCKGCASDCPTGIDMAAYKAEVLHQSFRGRVRPRSHYSLGWLPLWARLASLAPRLANAVASVPGVRRLGLGLAGIDPRRNVPRFAPATFGQWFARRPTAASAARGDVLLWVDTFTNHFSPEVGQAAVEFLESSGYRVRVPERQLCCGLTLISTGQLDRAKRTLEATVGSLAAYASEGLPIVGLEPSCTGVLRSDSEELLGSAESRTVAAATRTLAEFVRAHGIEVPDLSGTTAVAQPHCHHHAVMGWDDDARLLADAGADVQQLGGCCGLAGNFGVEQGHYDVSVAVAEQQLLPALRSAGPETVVLADGYSCRTQVRDLTERRGVHLAELLARAARSAAPGGDRQSGASREDPRPAGMPG